MAYVEVPSKVVAKLQRICLKLPDAYEEKAWVGVRWMVRKKTFAHTIGVDKDSPPGLQRAFGSDPIVVVTFRSSGPELDALKHLGHPYFAPGWGRDVVGMVLDTKTDWVEVKELLTDSYCVMAPKKLAALVQR